MIAELGHFAMILALFLAVAQSGLGLVGALRDDGVWMAGAGATAIAQFAGLTVAFAALTYGHVVSDFSLATVAANSHSAMPMLYKVTGVWGNHEGSMLLWVLILALFGAAIALFGMALPAPLRARVLGVQGLVGVGFLLFLAATSNPFARLAPAPLDGADLNPLLQDPGLAFHPPMLYLGYVGLSVAFSFAVAALIEGRVDPAWARWVRPWTLAAWVFLTLGIGLGSWWAYYELGWGGWWFWDPVENASFMPWLAATALLHSASVAEKRDALKSWTVLLAILAFSLSLMGTFLVRSGVLTSVHAFATDPERGVFILVLLVIAIGGALALFAVRAPSLRGGGLFRPISREGGLVLNNLLFATATATVLLGTLYPLFLDAVGGPKVSVGAPYFNATFVPVTLPLAILAAVGPMLPWKRADLGAVLSRLWIAAAAAGVAGLWVWWRDTGGPLGAIVGIAFAVWLACGVLIEWGQRLALTSGDARRILGRLRGLPRAAHGMTLAHLGLAVFICGAVGDSFWKQEVIREVKPGETLTIADYQVTLDRVSREPGPNYTATVAHLSVRDTDGVLVTQLRPEKRFYPVQAMPTTEAAIWSRPAGDLYAVIDAGGPPRTASEQSQRQPAEAPARWLIRLYFNPLVPWLWAGVVMMAAGGGLSLTDRRLRVGAPARRPAVDPAVS
ncbi:MAG: heme lyase CcmF/NrfE family subunit [Pseudomonadota bacterium]|nr:heme lyase CcmF/NrfE family subunit [Pseudomonadota bacterium]